MIVTALILGDPPPDLEERRRAALEREPDPRGRQVIRNRSRIPGSGRPVRKG